jgi:hypothetical protein
MHSFELSSFRNVSFMAASISSAVLPIRNSPGGIIANFMPTEFVYSTGTLRYAAHSS